MDAKDIQMVLNGGAAEYLSNSQPAETQPSSTPDDSQPVETSGNPNPDSATPASTETATQTGDDTQPPKEEPNPAPKEDKNKDKPKDGDDDLGDPRKLPYPKATKPTSDAAQYKANKAFIKQKQKYKAKIKGLEEQLAAAQNQLKAFQNVDPESLDDKQKATFGIDKRILEHDIQNLARNRQDAIDEYESAQADAIHQSRIEKCFTDQAEIDHYNKLLENGRDKFVEFLSQVDPENAVLQYLDDTDNSPLMVRLLMTRPDILKTVISKRSPMAKAMELKSIETRLMMQRRLRSTSPTTPPVNPTPAKVATTGKVVGNPTAKPSV